MATVSDSLTAQYQHDGYFIVEDLLTPTELATLRQRMADISAGVAPTFPEQNLEFEPKASSADGRRAVRKINHCAENDDVFRAHAALPSILDTVEQMIGPDIKLFGSQCFMKPPGGIDKPYHQDSAYFAIEPRELITCWIALDDSTLENGCLWVVPGSHLGPMLDHDQPWKVGDRVDMQVRDDQIDFAREAPLTLRAGSASFHHSMLLHRSGPNNSSKSRRGLAIHYMTSRSRWTHPTQPKPDYLLLRGREYEGCV